MESHNHFRSMGAAKVEVGLLQQLQERPLREPTLSERLGVSIRRIESAVQRLLEDGIITRNPKSRTLCLVKIEEMQ